MEDAGDGSASSLDLSLLGELSDAPEDSAANCETSRSSNAQ